MKQFVFSFCLVLVIVSCSRNPLKINVSNVELKLEVKHLDQDLLNLKPQEIEAAIPRLKGTYKGFFDIFTYRMIKIGGVEQDNFVEQLSSFTSDTLIRSLQANVKETIDTIQLRKDLTDAFKHYKYYFPQKPVPVIYTCISGFNQSVVTADSILGVSLDKYLGVKSRYYLQLGLPAYKRKNMHPKRMVPDMIYAWGISEWPMNDKVTTLLSNMIAEGKVMYFVDAMLPDMADTLKLGFSKKQLEFCEKNEAQMWTYLAEHKQLFNTTRMDIKRFMDDGPYTSAFTEESPGRTGMWLGLQIVRSYMKEHKDVKLPDLMNNTDYQGILNQSGYQP
ncbi:MAG: hypothetical protein ACM3P1_08980 [Candidatus Saccharibacteria bacterium]